MLPYEKTDLYFPSLSGGDIVPIPVPGRFFLQKLNICEAGGGAYNATLYSRPFVNPIVPLATITTQDGKAKLKFTYPHPFQVGDRLLVAGTSVSGYHTTHEVTGGVSELELVTDQDYSADATGGTAALTLEISRVRSVGGKTLLTIPTGHIFKAGDQITVAGTTVGGYNTTHTVTKDIDDTRVLTDIAWSADLEHGGTAVLAVAAANKPLYEVIPLTAASGGVVRYEKDFGKPAINQERRRKQLQSFTPRLYLLLSGSGTYRVSIAGQQIQ